MDAVETKEITPESCEEGSKTASLNSEKEAKWQADLDLEIAQAAHLFDRLDSDVLDNPANSVIGI
jgi:hypothetical protein